MWGRVLRVPGKVSLKQGRNQETQWLTEENEQVGAGREGDTQTQTDRWGTGGGLDGASLTTSHLTREICVSVFISGNSFAERNVGVRSPESATVRLSFTHPWTQHVVCTQNPRIRSCTLVVEVQGA